MKRDLPPIRKSLGQHFLNDRRILQRIVDALELTGSETVIEVGPGRGSLSELLVRQNTIEITFKTKNRELPQIWALKYDGARTARIAPQQTADGFSFAAQAVTNLEVFGT